MKLGRKLPKVWKPALTLDRYLADRASYGSGRGGSDIFFSRTAAIRSPMRPLGARWESKAIHLLHDPAGNDMVGDCTCAAIVKLDVAWSHNVGDVAYAPAMAPAALGLYAHATGYDPSKTDASGNNPTDNGAELSDILAFVQKNGIDAAGRGKSVQWVEVDATKPEQVANAIDIFGGLYTGVSLSPDWLGSTERDGVVWDVAAPGSPEEGHCVAAFDYNEQGVIINTWGYFVTVTWAALAKYWGKSAGGEVYAVFSPDWLDEATRVSPSGFNAAQLAADLKALG